MLTNRLRVPLTHSLKIYCGKKKFDKLTTACQFVKLFHSQLCYMLFTVRIVRCHDNDSNTSVLS